MKKIGLVIILMVVAVILSWATIFYYKYLKEDPVEGQKEFITAEGPYSELFSRLKEKNAQ